MKPATRSSIQMFAAWCGVGYIVLILVGWAVIGGFFPPSPPTTSAEQVAQFFQADYTRVRVGMVIVMISALVFIPFAALMTQFISRIEGGAGVLTYTCLLGAAGNMVLSFYPAIWWLVAVFRPERAPELMYLMNDMAWLQFIGGVTMYLAMPISVAITAFVDKSPNPVFPRWSAFANGWIIVLIIPDQLLFFFHQGPFSWAGIFGLYIPVGAFAVWFLLVFFLMRNTILRERGAGAVALQPA